MEQKNILNIIEDKFSNLGKNIMLEQVKRFYEIENIVFNEEKKYNIGEEVFLKKGTLLHGTYKNLDGLRQIVKTGLVASDFINSRKSKYPACVGVWNLKKDYNLKDYINFYSGATIRYGGLLINNEYSQEIKTEVIKYDDLNRINNILKNNPCRIWNMEQTKEARFMPSLAQNKVQIGIIFKNNYYTKQLVENGDILNDSIIDDLIVKEFVNADYYERFIEDRKSKDDFFTDRESAILYGIPSNCIDGILVGREYEKDEKILVEIKNILPNSYICNLDGIVIIGN